MATSFTWSELPVRDPVTGSKTTAYWIQRSQVLAWRTANIVVISHVLYLALRIVTNSANPLFFNAWFPFDLNNTLGYSFVLVLQGFGSIILANLLFGFICLYVSLVAIGCTQLEKIQISLLDLKQIQNEPHCVLKSGFVKCVQHHQQVLRYMRALEDMFHVVLVGPFLSVAVTLCFAAFTALTISGNHEESIQILLVIFAFLCQIQACCWFGNELTIQSGRVRDAAWGSEWIGSPISHQRSINIMMTVSKEFSVTAGKIIPVSRHTMMTVMNQAYTYLMFLVNFMERSSTRRGI
ncbi:odorant receptor 4-like [Zootermopsis nevadensis]|nr:odorant receptor 4-like [Zootermopsis nevadensis]